jgi:hypothetical protein
MLPPRARTDFARRELRPFRSLRACGLRFSYPDASQPAICFAPGDEVVVSVASEAARVHVPHRRVA